MIPPDRLPYPGLRSFRRDEADLFFGRESAVDQMVERLAATRFLAVLGSSGSGKSSLVRTGLLDALELGLMAAAGPNWRIAELHPAGRPFENLAEALLALPHEEAAPGESGAASLARRLREGPRSVIRWCQEGDLPERANLLILVDQFEELFRYADYAGREEAEAFVALLLESAEAPVPIYVVMTMRSEFLGPCALIPDLAERIDAGLYLTRRMTREETRQAIVGPAGVCGFTIEPVLVNHLLNDLASFAPWEGERGVDQLELLARRADQLPLLQHVLNRLWVLAHQRDETGPITLRLETYEALGGFSGALNAHAEEVLAEIAPLQRPAAEPAFRALVSGGSLASAVRRPCRFNELVEVAGGDQAAAEAVVEAFRDPACNFLIASPEGRLEPETMIDISHESLIRQWRRLSDWVQAEAQAAEEYRYIEKTASRWKAGHAALLRMPYLATALAWQAREHPSEPWARRYGGDFALAKQFLEQSGRRWRTRQRFAFASAGLAGLAILVGVPWIAYQENQISRLRAATSDVNIAMVYLTGVGMVNGHFVSQDYRQARTLLRMADLLGSGDADFWIGYMYQKGYSVRQDPKEAAKWIRKAADRGNAAAENNIGHGYYVKRDYHQAMTWYRKAADQGDPTAEDNVADLFEHGYGVNRDYVQAKKWYGKAADQNDPSAAFSIGYLYEQGGYGVKQDYGQAMGWYRTAARQGDAAAENNIGYMFENAHGVTKKDYVQAMTWYQKAADHGDATAAFNAGHLYQRGGYGIKQDYGQAMQWYRKAADHGNTDAAFSIGGLYRHGYGVKQDYTQAIRWYRTAAADHGDASAALNIGYIYENGGYGVRQDYGQAMTWYRKAAGQGDPVAENNIGYMFQNGYGVNKDYIQAMTWYRQAADHGDATAAFNVGYLYQHGGYGIKQDYLHAMTWYRQAADHGIVYAIFDIGYLYQHGYGVKPDDTEALVWFQKAAARGDPDGARLSGEILARQGKYDAALAAYRQSVKNAQAELAKTPGDSDAKNAIRQAAQGIGNISYEFLMRGQFQQALDAAELAIGFAPQLTWLETNHADALMMLGRTDEARAIYLRYRGQRNVGGAPWSADVRGDFAALRKHGYSNPLMAEIEAKLAN